MEQRSTGEGKVTRAGLEGEGLGGQGGKEEQEGQRRLKQSERVRPSAGERER